MGNDPIFQSTSDKLSWQIIQTKSTGDDKIENLVTKVDTPLQFPVRYNPNKDDGTHNRCYLLSVSKPKIGYDPPTDLNLQLDGFPLWTTIWGFTDYIKKLQITQQTDISYILVLQNGTTNPNWETIVPLDWDFCNGRSPLQGGENPDVWDQNKWYPQLQYQNQAMNDIAFCGPGAPKYTDIKSDEIKLEYEFHFKLGGNPLPMAEVHNPLLQGTFPTPSNIKQTTSLQNPTTPIETYLQGFDQRRGFLTKAAIERISKDWGLKKPSFKNFNRTLNGRPSTPNTPNIRGRSIDRGRKRRDTVHQAHQAATETTATQAANPTNITTNTKYRITKCTYKAYLFEPPQKNRRLTPKEYEGELELAKIFKRPPRQMLLDPPFYPWTVPEPLVNFKLNFSE